MVKKEKEKEFIQFSILFRAEYTEKKKKKHTRTLNIL